VLYSILPGAVLPWVAGAPAFSAIQLEGFGSFLGQVLTLIEAAYARAPILVLALSALVILPLAAVLSLAAQAGWRRRSLQSALRAAERRAQSDPPIKEMPETEGLQTLQQAWLTVEGRRGATIALAGQVIRIGRSEDNDIRLPDWSVHRHHAVIERTAGEVFVITDVSGKDGSGVRVNGARTAQARLADGDVIELGKARLRFENAPI
jgi:pSer/pThr/pTyr-binding forkhead associated (FHA) protein